MPDRMLVERDSSIGWMIFDHPERRNAVTQAMWLQIGEILEDFAKDETIRVVVLKGAGDKAFVSGADISQFGQQRRNAAEVAASNRLTDAARQALATFPKPTIAMIQGYCLGGGLAIALMCDLRFASEDSTFGIPAARLGVGYGAASVGMLQALVGPAYTREILFTGRRFSGEEALRMGLINRLLPRPELTTYVQDYATMIGANAPLTLRAAKLASIELLKPEAERDLVAVQRAVEACFDSADYQEGRTAFLEKRPPIFTGR
ncbi:MAG TPA: enoyl-CoA hydratase [Alphaproteobacteria bacterium]|nr:enoyl-CoA hydratase [Alphaproteobacteria bacterium]